jgi:hypothetical protein
MSATEKLATRVVQDICRAAREIDPRGGLQVLRLAVGTGRLSLLS